MLMLSSPMNSFRELPANLLALFGRRVGGRKPKPVHKEYILRYCEGEVAIFHFDDIPTGTFRQEPSSQHIGSLPPTYYQSEQTYLFSPSHQQPIRTVALAASVLPVTERTVKTVSPCLYCVTSSPTASITPVIQRYRGQI